LRWLSKLTTMSALTKTSIIATLYFIITSCQSSTKNNNPKEQFASVADNVDSLYSTDKTLIDGYVQSITEIKPQQFILPAKANEWVIAKKGFKIKIDTKKLCNPDGSALSNENIQVNITELLNTDELMAANATTVSNGKMLMSGGSYFVEVTQNKQTLQLKKDASLEMQIPNRKKEGMQLFTGTKNQQGFVNWQPTQSRFIAQRYYPSISNFYKDYESEKVRDSIGKRPATLAECMKIFNDSTMKARWAYTIANRHVLTHKQEMAYGLRPIEFPFHRYKQNIVKNTTTYFGCHTYRNIGTLYATSTMYMIEDTFPVYKEVITTRKVEGDKKNKLDYYEPIETYTLGWINVDKFYNVPMCDSTMLVFNNAKMSQCKVYYKFTELNSLLAESIQFKKTDKETSYTSSINLPKNESIEIIVIGVQNGKIVQGRKKITSKKENRIAIQLQEITQSRKQT
jgi:hypothetical protein